MFDDEKIRIIESMPDADSLLVIWVKLLCQAGKTYAGGYISLNENVPYTEEELASVLSRPLNTVKLALSVFQRLEMIELSNQGLYIKNFPKHQNIEAIEHSRKLARDRQQKHRLLASKNPVTRESQDSHTDITAQTKTKTKTKKKTKKENKNKEEDINTYKNQLKIEFPNIDIEEEYKKFVLWWEEGNRELKRPKLAFRNWIKKATQPTQGKNAGVNKINSDDPDKYTKGKYGHMVRR